MKVRRGGCRSRLIAVAIGLSPLLLLEIALHLQGYGNDVVRVFGPEIPVFVRNGEMMELAPEHRGQFRTEPFLAEKAPGTTRIIVVGDSTAYGVTWAGNRDEDGRTIVLPDPYPVLLERALAQEVPDRSFEVINCGGWACATYRLQRVVREVVTYSPDLVIFMAGSSDFLEFRLIGDWRKAHPLWAGLQRHWKTLTLARNLLRDAQGRPDRSEEGKDGGEDPLGSRSTPGETVAFHATDLPILPTDVVRNREEVEQMLADSAQNIGAIVKMCQEQSVPLILCTVPANLRMHPSTDTCRDQKLARLMLEGLSEKISIRFGRVADRVTSLVNAGEFRQALTLLGQTRLEFSDDPRVSLLHFLEGRAHESLGDWKSARRAFIRAKDRDPFIWRFLDGANEAVRRLSDQEGVLLADVERAFMLALPDGIPDGRLFYDYCHFRPVGHAITVRELMAVMEREGGL
jgi:hypothetical protein